MWYNPLFNICTGHGDGKITEKRLAAMKNDIAFQNVFASRLQDALKRYKITGLPDTLSERVILQAFLYYAGCSFFEKDGGLYALPCAPSSGVNVYGDPDTVFAFGMNGFNEEVKVFVPGGDESAFLKEFTGGMEDNKKPYGVYVWENRIRYPFINQVLFYSNAIADTMRTLDVVRDNIKNPYVITAEESCIPTVQDYFKRRSNNERFIISTGIFPVDKVNVINLQTGGTQLTDTVELIEWYENKYRELCGFSSNSQIDKKGENLISDEVHVNDQFEEIQVDKCIDCMNEGFDLVNKFFGTNIKAEQEEHDNDKDVLTDQNGSTGNESVPGGDQ